MSLFIETLVEMLRIDSALQNPDNDLRKVLDLTIGEYMDASEVVFDQLFLSSATGGWLDAFGRDFGVPRRLDEDDESYRERIIFEKLEYLTVGNLQSIYGLDLYAFVSGFNPTLNQLTSDNPYISNRYMGIADESTIDILNKKFILDSGIVWLDNHFTNPNVIFNSNDEDVLYKYLSVLSQNDVNHYFSQNSEVYDVKLKLDNAISCNNLFEMCVNLNSVDLELSNATECSHMFEFCSSLTSIALNLPKLVDYGNMFLECNNIETIDVKIATSQVSGFKSYVLGLSLSNLTSFKINGEEQL